MSVDNDDDVRVSFELYDYRETPEEITRIIGTPPAGAYLPGDVRLVGPTAKPAKITVRHSMWYCDSRLTTTSSAEDQIYDLVAMLWDSRAAVKELADKYVARISCTAIMRTDRPTLCLKADLLEKLSQLGVDLDFDGYDHRSVSPN